jgi:hypothetical protein
MGVSTPEIQASRHVLGPVDVERGTAWLVGCVPVIYLALSGGGYDIIARSEVGIALWWIVLLGVLVGVLPRVRYTRSAWVGLLLLAAFLAWTVIATGWSQSEERTLAEAARVATYLGVFVLGLSLMTHSAVRSLLSGLAFAITLVSGLAVLSRLVPGWFPVDSARHFYATARLSYPFDYADGVGEFAALGIPLLLFVATSARTLVGRALGAAGLPVVVLCLALTVSRGGILAAAAGLVVFFALSPDRLPRLATAAAAAAASVVVLVALSQRAGVRDSFKTVAPAGERHTMLLVLVLACAGVALAQLGITLAVRFGARPRWLAVSRRRASAFGALLFAAVLIGVVVVIASGADHRLWQQFKEVNPRSGGTQYSRLLSVAGSHRYQYWQAAVAAFHTNPWKGIGPGTFEFYWAQHNSLAEFVRNAHSLYIETLAELGIIGLALIGGFFAFVLGAGSTRAMRAPPPDRAMIATAVAGVAAFCAAAAFDWVWQIGAIPYIGLLLAAAALTGLPARDRIGSARRLLPMRIILAVGTILALWAIVVPLATAIAVRSSQAEAAKGNLRAALTDAATAQRLESSAATPRLERALILEQLGDVSGASQSIAQASAREPNNWRLWLVASRIATESNRPGVALADYRRARRLNPTSPIFAK